jgi:hypothetical protein
VCIPSPFCGHHGVSLLLPTHSLPPRAKGTQQDPLSPPRKVRNLLAGSLSYQPHSQPPA